MSVGFSSSEKTKSDTPRFEKEFLKAVKGAFSKYLIISMPTAPTTIAVVAAIAGTILPAINLTFKCDTSFIL